jgi:phospholipase/carboxylesterase
MQAVKLTVINLKLKNLMLYGPSVEPTSGSIKRIVIFLHGYGASGSNLIDIADEWKHALSDTLFVAPNAPERCDVSPSGYQWFGLADFNPFNIAQGLDRTTPKLHAYITHLMQTHKVAAKDIALVGFSQGTILSLNMLFSDITLGCIVGYSGAFYPPINIEQINKSLSNNSVQSPISTHSAVLLVHGTHDTVVPYAAMHQAQMALSAYKIKIETHTCHGLEHSIDHEGLKEGIKFLTKHLIKS